MNRLGSLFYFFRIFTARSIRSRFSRIFSRRSLSRFGLSARNLLTMFNASSLRWPPMNAPSQPFTKNIFRLRLWLGSSCKSFLKIGQGQFAMPDRIPRPERRLDPAFADLFIRCEIVPVFGFVFCRRDSRLRGVSITLRIVAGLCFFKIGEQLRSLGVAQYQQPRDDVELVFGAGAAGSSDSPPG